MNRDQLHPLLGRQACRFLGRQPPHRKPAVIGAEHVQSRGLGVVGRPQQRAGAGREEGGCKVSYVAGDSLLWVGLPVASYRFSRACKSRARLSRYTRTQFLKASPLKTLQVRIYSLNHLKCS